MILSQLLPDNLPIVRSTVCENLGFIYNELNLFEDSSITKKNSINKLSSGTFYQLIYVTQGEAILEYGSLKHISIDRPFIYFSAPGRSQKLTMSGKVKGHILLISKDILLDILNKLPDARISYRDESFILDLSNKAQTDLEIGILQNSFESIAEELQKKENLGLRALLLCWIRLAHEGSALFMTHHRNAIKFRKYLNLIDENYKFHWTLSQYAAKLNITVSTLNNICRELGGESAKEYVFQRILKEAEFLLRYTDHTIIEIAHKLGFKDSSYFTRFFKRYTSLNPKKYRLTLI